MDKKRKNAPKLEPISVESLAGLDERARLLFLHRAAKSAPGLAFELSKTFPAEKAFEEVHEESWRGAKNPTRGAFGAALAGGHLALARLWAFKRRREPQQESGSSRKAPPATWRSAMETLNASRLDDEQIWRARGWLALACGKDERLGPLALSASELVETAIESFCAGRPKLGMLWALELLERPAVEVARASAAATPWPSRLRPGLWGESCQDRTRLAKVFNDASKADRDQFGRALAKASDCALLEHLSYWSQELAPSDPLASAALEELGARLWDHGAFAEPKRHASLFAVRPYGAEDPRAELCVEAAKTMGPDAGALAARGSKALEGERAVFAALLARAAASPDMQEGDAKAWDAFVQAHAGALQASPNPFTACGPSSAALLSLAGDARLIEIGLERGFDPAPSHWVLAAPGAMIKAFEHERLNEPALARAAWGFCSHAALPPGVALAPEPEGRGKGSARKDGLAWVDTKGQKGAISASEGWTLQSLASLALACGRMKTARALAKAGCPQGTMIQAIQEAQGSRKALVEKVAARAESEALLDASERARPCAAPSKKQLRV